MSEPRPLIFKVSEKKAISIYGINSRFPVTLYKNQLLRLLDHSEEIKKFIENNSNELAVKEKDETKEKEVKTKVKKEKEVKTKVKKEKEIKKENKKEIKTDTKTKEDLKEPLVPLEETVISPF